MSDYFVKPIDLLPQGRDSIGGLLAWNELLRLIEFNRGTAATLAGNILSSHVPEDIKRKVIEAYNATVAKSNAKQVLLEKARAVTLLLDLASDDSFCHEVEGSFGAAEAAHVQNVLSDWMAIDGFPPKPRPSS